jgi:peptidoglycan L-alanyl-D-glutamate endopeptidase CwlK
MSAGAKTPEYHLAKPTHDLTYLAPLFRDAVMRAIAECNSAENKLNALVYETYRSNELAQLYYARGRDNPPPPAPIVTNAKTNLYSWHGYGLAVDVIHKTKGWDAGDKWFRDVAAIFKKHGCKWGGDWTFPDRPHFQWGKCKPSPSDRARELITSEGIEKVWEVVGALPTPAVVTATT